MTIDERLERLTERHEALAQTVELMVAENRAEGRRQDARINELINAINIDADNIRRLAKIAEAHERRLDRLENA